MEALIEKMKQKMTDKVVCGCVCVCVCVFHPLYTRPQTMLVGRNW